MKEKDDANLPTTMHTRWCGSRAAHLRQWMCPNALCASHERPARIRCGLGQLPGKSRAGGRVLRSVWVGTRPDLSPVPLWRGMDARTVRHRTVVVAGIVGFMALVLLSASRMPQGAMRPPPSQDS